MEHDPRGEEGWEGFEGEIEIERVREAKFRLTGIWYVLYTSRMPVGVYPRPKRDVLIVIGPSIAYIPLTQGQYALIDLEDATRIKHSWYAAWSSITHSYYAQAHKKKLHRFLMRARKGQQIDHRNRNGLDNRKSNLRFVTSMQNSCNRGIRRDNTSGHPGVYKVGNRFRVKLMHNKKILELGRFSTFDQAVNAYRTASSNLPEKFQRPLYDIAR